MTEQYPYTGEGVKSLYEAPVEHNWDLDKLSKIMEEMANAPKEEMGKRTPGERCMYEIQRKDMYKGMKEAGVYSDIGLQ